MLLLYALVSFVLVYVAHTAYNYLKTAYTVSPKKDLGAVYQQKYQRWFEDCLRSRRGYYDRTQEEGDTNPAPGPDPATGKRSNLVATGDLGERERDALRQMVLIAEQT